MGAWILYSRGRVDFSSWVLPEGHRWFFLLQWSTSYVICLQYANEWREPIISHHRRSPFWWWPWTQPHDGELKLYLGWIRRHRGSKGNVWGMGTTTSPVADPGFPRRGVSPTSEFGMKIYYLTTFLAKTVWKWKTPSDRGLRGRL